MCCTQIMSKSDALLAIFSLLSTTLDYYITKFLFLVALKKKEIKRDIEWHMSLMLLLSFKVVFNNFVDIP